MHIVAILLIQQQISWENLFVHLLLLISPRILSGQISGFVVIGDHFYITLFCITF